MWRKQRMGELTSHQAADLVSEFEADYSGTHFEPSRFVLIAVTVEVLAWDGELREAAAREGFVVRPD